MPSKIDLGGLQIDLPKAIRVLRQDLRDDWFPDPIKFADCLNVETIYQYIQSNIDLNHGVYIPEPTEAFNVPKKGFLLRYSLESNVYDRLIFLALVSELIPHYDLLLSENSLSHRLNQDEKRNKKYIFKHHVEQYKAYEGLTKNAAKGKFLLITDVFNYYENIQVDQLKICLEKKVPSLKTGIQEKIRIRRAIDLLTTYLKSWSFNGVNGLPQNRDAASFLANMLVKDVKQEMRRQGFEYFRYMDDIRIACENEIQARKALKLLSETLRKIGLNLNSAKTNIGKLTDPEIQKSFITLDRKLESLDNMWKSKSLELIKKSIPYLKEYTTKAIADGSTGDRSFRFAIRRIEGALSCDELEIPPDYFNEITDKIIADLENQPTATDTLIKYLSFVNLNEYQINKIIELICDPDKAIYSWQNYWIWNFFILRDIKSSQLLDHAKNLLSSNANKRQPDIAGAVLYIGKFGTPEDKGGVTAYYLTTKSPWFQRQALIALHELDYNQGIHKIAGHTHQALKGTYKRIKGKFSDIYATPPEKVNFEDLYDEGSIYD